MASEGGGGERREGTEKEIFMHFLAVGHCDFFSSIQKTGRLVLSWSYRAKKEESSMTIWIPEKAGRRAREELSTKGFERDFSALSRAAGARERGLRSPRFIVAGEDSRAEELLGWSKGCKGRCPMQTGKEDNGRSHASAVVLFS